MSFTFESFSTKYLYEQYSGNSMREKVIKNTSLILGAAPSCHYDDHDTEVHQMPEQRRPEPQVPGMKCLTFTIYFHLFKAGLSVVHEKK